MGLKRFTTKGTKGTKGTKKNGSELSSGLWALRALCAGKWLVPEAALRPVSKF